jgi:uncharacterized coiled-coil protein SlyX
MYQRIQIKNAALSLRSFIVGARRWQDLLIIALAVVLAPSAQAVTPAPDGDYGNQNTAEGGDALFNLQSSGINNTAIGFRTLYLTTSGSYNTATGALALRNNAGFYNTAFGAGALNANTNASYNTAVGMNALFLNTGGDSNTATGYYALYNNTTGSANTGNGDSALVQNTTGENNTANGYKALQFNTTGSNNTADGFGALLSNGAGNNNTATGYEALVSNTGDNNTAHGFEALYNNSTGINNTASGVNALVGNTTGSGNVAIGYQAGSSLTTGSNNIDIGPNVLGTAGESNTIRIGRAGTQKATFIQGISGATVANGVQVVVSPAGKLGTVVSSARFKEEIKPMNDTSEVLLSLKPVTFKYKKDLDPDGIPQFGLVAEEVERVNPDLVARDGDGKVYTVRYEAVNAMLLNEFLKEHRKVEEQQATITQVKAALAQQQVAYSQQANEMKALAATVQKVSDRVEMGQRAPQRVGNRR